MDTSQVRQPVSARQRSRRRSSALSAAVASDLFPSLNSNMAQTTAPDSPARPKSSPFPHDPFRAGSAAEHALSLQQSASSSYFTLGQFSLPATQTTIVTTTTTTTTDIAPILFKTPKRVENLDPMQYPLADSPTPLPLRNAEFSWNGQRIRFREADDPQRKLEEYLKEQRQLQEMGGMLQTIKNENSRPGTPRAAFASDKASTHNSPADSEKANKFLAQARSQDEKPVISSSGRTTRLRSRLASSGSSSKPETQNLQTSTPITPSLVATRQSERTRRPSNLKTNLRSLSPEAKSFDSDQECGQTLSPRPENSEAESSAFLEALAGSSKASASCFPASFTESKRSRRSASRGSARNLTLDVSTATEGALPSPSLSPSAKDSSTNTSASAVPSNRHSEFPFATDSGSDAGMAADEHPNVTMQEIWAFINRFSGLPQEMQGYTMHTMLRWCNKDTLRSIADRINPALNCDFLTRLPPELSHQIICHLDLRSLCRASQVSRKWRHIIDSDETVWKDLLDAEGFEVSDDEMQRAIREGWGWQSETTLGGSERDLSMRIGAEKQLMEITAESPETKSQVSRAGKRGKRKAATAKRNSSRKMAKRKEVATEDDLAQFDTPLTRLFDITGGPHAFADAARNAIPKASEGLPTLRKLSLYKSIFRRHYLISQTWMQDEVKPKHLAFKAHSRHVVTCLQFDSDKVLTGSDDTHINVYDTRTGALRQTLNGHEGGVWAFHYVGNTLVSGSTDRTVRVWDIEKGICTHVFHGHTSTVRCLFILMPTVVGKTSEGRPILMPPEPLIITGSRDYTLRVWKLPNVNNGPETDATVEGGESSYHVRTLVGHSHSVRAIAAHGDTLVSGSYDFTVRVWKISTGETVRRLSGHTQKVYSVVLDHERNRCISGSMDFLVKVWSLSTGNCLYNLEGHTSLVGLLDLRRDLLVSAAADSTLRIWDPSSGRCEHMLSAHTGAITCFQHDGRKVISGSDRNLKMWNIQNGEVVRDLLTDLTGVWQVSFDERRCVAAVQRNGATYIELLDFGAARDGAQPADLGRRIVVDTDGYETLEMPMEEMAADMGMEDA